MKNKLILTTILLLSCAITGLYAAAPGGAGDAAVYKPSEGAASNLEDMWLFHSLIPEETAGQLAKNLSEAGIGSGAGTKDIAHYLKGAGGLFTPTILEKVRRNLILSGPAVKIELPLSKAYEGDYESFRDALIAYLHDELVKIGTNHRVTLNLSYKNLGELVRNNPDQCVDLMHAVNDIVIGHQCIVTQLNLYGNGLTTLPEDAFDQFDSLQVLHLELNRLTTLPPGIFDGLTNLQELWFYENQLASLPPGIFTGLTNLQLLWLGGNQLATLPAGIFAGLTRLQELWLNNNKLTNLPPGIFADLINLQGLWLYENQLATLPPDIFAELSNLQLLSLHSNQLATLPADIFAGLTNLQELRLYGNQLPPEEQEAIRRELPATTKIEF